MIIRGLVAITRNHNVRSLSIVTQDNTLFTIQQISNTKYVSLVKDGKSIHIEDEVDKYITFLKSFISIINIVSQISQSRYYTFLGEFKYNFKKKKFNYEPYVDLMKKVSIKVSTKSVQIVVGDVVKKFKRSKSGYTPEFLINTIEEILNRMIEWR